jgi:hypothetical protein
MARGLKGCQAGCLDAPNHLLARQNCSSQLMSLMMIVVMLCSFQAGCLKNA